MNQNLPAAPATPDSSTPVDSHVSAPQFSCLMQPPNLPLIVSIEKEAQDEVNAEEKEKQDEVDEVDEEKEKQDEVNEEEKDKQDEEKTVVLHNEEDGKEKEKTEKPEKSEKTDASLEYEEALQIYQEEAGKQIQAFIEDTVKLFKKHPFWQLVNSREKEGL